jgi:hypothetical protein
VGTALMAAIDGAPRLWEAGGVWRDRRIRRLYGLRPALRAALLVAALGCAVVGLPLAVLGTGLLAYPGGFLVGLLSPAGGRALVQGYTALLARAFDSGFLLDLLPRLALLTIVLAVLVVAGAALREVVARGDRRREQGAWWSRVVAAPWHAGRAAELFREALWKGLRGAASLKPPPPAALSRRYVEVLTDNFGQPGFRELVLVTHDLDARQDLVFALLADPFRQEFFRHGPYGVRRGGGDAIDLAGVGREHLLDALAGAASVPVLNRGHAMRFAVDSYWRGETHTLSDRAGTIARLLDETAAAGARQVVIVSATAARDRPHGLDSRRLTLRARAGEYWAGDERAALDDALRSRGPLFEGVFAVSPLHSPIGPFDFAGGRDERSDRAYPLTELLDRGYEDAYVQFIEPVVGGSGERL